MKTDVLIIGSGIAGLAFAIKLAERKPDLKITLVTKSDCFESNTKYAQGGIAAVMDNIHNSFKSHINDTLKAGKGFSDIQTVKLVVEKASKRLQELIDWGTYFDKTPEGKWDYALEGGHSVARILHHKDQTGLALEKALLNQLKNFKNIDFQTELFATDLLIKNKQCYGVRFLNKKEETLRIFSKVTYLATGGSGQVFSKTTNPLIATGDGLAMASRAGVKIAHMGFFQFHPTALAIPNTNPVFLITEALRGFGAFITNEQQERFLFRFHPDGELATRDVICNAIFKEMHKKKRNSMWMDCRHLDSKKLNDHFPKIIQKCKQYGIDVFKEPIPIAPAAHYQCGGIQVNRKGETSLSRLYANGECASTGLHGANRLASNSLLEALVFAHEAALEVSKKIDTYLVIDDEFLGEKSEAKKPYPIESQIIFLKNELQKLMYQFYLNKSLKAPLVTIKTDIDSLIFKINTFTLNHKESISIWELQNLAETSRLIVNDIIYE